jgi:hypothetical protein
MNFSAGASFITGKASQKCWEINNPGEEPFLRDQRESPAHKQLCSFIPSVGNLEACFTLDAGGPEKTDL